MRFTPLALGVGLVLEAGLIATGELIFAFFRYVMGDFANGQAGRFVYPELLATLLFAGLVGAVGWSLARNQRVTRGAWPFVAAVGVSHVLIAAYSMWSIAVGGSESALIGYPAVLAVGAAGVLCLALLVMRYDASRNQTATKRLSP
jgi:hypothetical protein